MCRLSKERSKDGSGKTVGNETIIGQISSFMDALHLTKEEVMSTPYSVLLMMQKDKLHEASGDIVKEVSGKEMLKKRNEQKNTSQ